MPPPAPRDRPLTTIDLTLLVVASMIGAGVFTTSGFALKDLGYPGYVLAAWGVGGVIAICGAIGYGALVDRLLGSGGEYLFLSRLVHPAAGFLAGWISLIAGFTAAAAFAALTFDVYLRQLLSAGPIPAGFWAIAVIVLAAVNHLTRTSYGARGQNLIVIIKLTLLVGFVAYALIRWGQWQGPSEPAVANFPTSPPLWSFATTVMWISLSYAGFNAAIYIADEARDGQRGVRRSMVWATLVVTLLYLVLNAIFLYAPAADVIRGNPAVAAEAAQAIGGGWLRNLVSVAICLALASSVSAMLMLGPRVYTQMAVDGLLPKCLLGGGVGQGDLPPRRAILLQAAIVLPVVFIASLRQLLDYLGLTLSLCSAATVAVVVMPRWIGVPVAWYRRGAAAIYVAATLIVALAAAVNRPALALAAVLTVIAGAIAWVLVAAKPQRSKAN